MSRSPKHGAISYEVEGTWGENLSQFGTRLQPLGPVDLSGLTQELMTPDRLVQLTNEITPGVKGILGGTFRTRFHFHGHGSTCAGAIALNDLETLLGIVLGAAVAAGAGTTCDGTGTEAAPGVALAAGISAGALVRIGALGDGAGNGQLARVATHAASVLDLDTALDGIPALGAVVYNPALIHTIEDPTASHQITGTRWLLQTANQQAECHGCYPRSIQITGLGAGGEKLVDIEWGVSWWKPIAAGVHAFPSAAAVQTFPHAPVANGSLFLADYGVAARSKETIRDFSLTITLGIVELKGPGGVHTNQLTLGCVRTSVEVAGEFVIDAEDATAAPRLAGEWDAQTKMHLLYTFSAEDSTAGGIYLPVIYPSGPKPTQADVEGLNRTRFAFRAGADAAGTTNLTRAALVLASC